MKKIKILFIILTHYVACHNIMCRDFHIVTGKLQNGLTYHIIPQTGNDKLDLRLIIPAGSIHEENNGIKGTAHFLEHMAFEGSENFPGTAMTKYVESLGESFGKGMNAVTSYNMTMFMLNLPQNDEHVPDSAILMASDWLHRLSLRPEAVEKQRKIILEERLQYSSYDPFDKIKKGTGPYAGHIPIGETEDIMKISPEDISSFYEKWYNPQIATLIIATKYPVSTIEQYIKIHFGNITAKPGEKPSAATINYPDTITTGIHVSPDAIKNTIEITFPHSYMAENNYKDIVNEKTDDIAAILANKILCGDSGFSCGNSWYLGGTSHMTLTCSGKNLSEIVKDAKEIIRRINFMQKEGIGKIPDDFFKNILEETAGTVKMTNENSAMNDLIDNIVENHYFVTDSANHAKIVSEIKRQTLENISERIKDIFGKTPFITLETNSADNRKVLEDLKKEFSDKKYSDNIKLTYKTTSGEEENDEKIAELPEFVEKIRYRNKKYFPNLGITSFKYPNGIELMIKPCNNKNNSDCNIYITSDKGYDAINPKDYAELESTVAYTDMSGVCNIPKSTWDNTLYKNGIAINSFMKNHFHGYRAKAPGTGIKTLFKVIRLKMTEPEICEAELEECKKEQMNQMNDSSVLKNMIMEDPSYACDKFKSDFLGEKDFMPDFSPDKESIGKLSAKKMQTFYKNLFGTTVGTLCFVTAAPADTFLVRNEFEKIMATIPQHKRLTSAYEKQGNKKNMLMNGCPASAKTGQMTCHHFFGGEINVNLKNTLILKILRQHINNLLIQRLREEKGIVYSPYVFLEYNFSKNNKYLLHIENTIRSENEKELDIQIQDIINHISENQMEEKTLKSIKEAFKANKAQFLDDDRPDNWIKIISEISEYGFGFENYDNYDKILDSITPSDIRKYAKKYLYDIKFKKNKKQNIIFKKIIVSLPRY